MFGFFYSSYLLMICHHFLNMWMQLELEWRVWKISRKLQRQWRWLQPQSCEQFKCARKILVAFGNHLLRFLGIIQVRLYYVFFTFHWHISCFFTSSVLPICIMSKCTSNSWVIYWLVYLMFILFYILKNRYCSVHNTHHTHTHMYFFPSILDLEIWLLFLLEM